MTLLPQSCSDLVSNRSSINVWVILYKAEEENDGSCLILQFHFIFFFPQLELHPLLPSLISASPCFSSGFVHSTAPATAKPKLRGHLAVCKSIWNASVCGNRIRLVSHTSLVPPLPPLHRSPLLEKSSSSPFFFFFLSKAYTTISISYRKA